MRGKIKTLATVAGIAISVLAFMPETASARMGVWGSRGGTIGLRGAGLGAAGIRTGAIGSGFGYRGAGLGYRGAALGWRGGAVGWRGGALGWRGAGLSPGWRGGWGYRYRYRWPYYAAGAALGYGLASSYYNPDYYYGGYDDGYGYDGCVVERRLVLTDWGYRPALVRVCY